MIKAVLFDFGGVLAEEGFREGLKAIAGKHGINPDMFYAVASELVYETGYVTGGANESDYWNALRKEAGIRKDDEALRHEILGHFVLRTEMIKIVQELKEKGFIVGILSDQTNWLGELDEKDDFLRHFDYVFNSYRIHKSKRDPSLFTDVCGSLGLSPEEVLFVDDNIENVQRAGAQGLKIIYFRDIDQFKTELRQLIQN